MAQKLVTYTYDEDCVSLVIPNSLLQRVTSSLHAGHQGLDSMLRRFRQSIYWPRSRAASLQGLVRYMRDPCTVGAIRDALLCTTNGISVSDDGGGYVQTGRTRLHGLC